GWTFDGAVYRSWWRQREAIKAAASHQKHLEGGGRMPLFELLEELLMAEIVNKHLRKEKEI
uniref:Uncharacterized protein n=1 Tax=Globisporangium ultimum (strain ATCC 200006 / CBS 805.95 / DAOM BR144) TaxID=431595 RepID=K3X6A9_GLOUD